MVKLREGTAGCQGPAMHSMMMDPRVKLLYLTYFRVGGSPHVAWCYVIKNACA